MLLKISVIFRMKKFVFFILRIRSIKKVFRSFNAKIMLNVKLNIKCLVSIGRKNRLLTIGNNFYFINAKLIHFYFCFNLLQNEDSLFLDLMSVKIFSM